MLARARRDAHEEDKEDNDEGGDEGGDEDGDEGGDKNGDEGDHDNEYGDHKDGDYKVCDHKDGNARGLVANAVVSGIVGSITTAIFTAFTANAVVAQAHAYFLTILTAL